MDALRSILVHLDGGARAADRLTAARQLAARHEAQVRALCAVSPVPHELALLHRRQAKARFDHMAQGGGWPVGWCAPPDEQPIPAFTRQALHADLLVLGQLDTGDDDTSTVPRDFVPAVTLGSGTPTLLLPRRGEVSGRFDTVLVAWHPTREAARALAASLPLLQAATEVHLVSWLADGHEAAREQQAVVDHLRLHGVDGVQRHRDVPPSDAGQALLTMAGEVGADLLVMGCYSRGPLREQVLGGATATVLREAKLPVLMAH